jgi:hypothetical protein
MKISDYYKLMKANYYRTTPVKIRKIADSVCISCFSITTASIIGNWPRVALFALIFGSIFKGISNFFVEEGGDAKQL